MDDFGAGLATVLAVIAVFLIGSCEGRYDVRYDCDRFGTFYVGSDRYECSAAEVP